MATTTTLILGGGFGGISTANTLRRLVPAEHDVVVVDRSQRFHVGAGKSWVMLGTRTYEEISRPRRLLLDPGVRFVETSVVGLDLANRTVALEKSTLRWDHLVIALGADLDLSKIPGLAEAAHTFYTIEGAQRLPSALKGFRGGDLAILIPKAPFACPPAPYEAAMLLHHAFDSRGLGDKVRIAIHTVEPAPMPTAGPEMGQFIKGELAARGIAYHPSKVTTRVDGAAQLIQFEDGSSARYDLLIAIPPHQAPKLVRDAQLTNPSGWIPVDPKTLRVTSRPDLADVYAVGDVAVVPLPGRYKPEVGLSLPKAGVFAEAHGRVAAHQIAAKLLSQPAGETFDGKGYCYLETGGDLAMKGEGSFFDLPHPVMARRAPDAAQFLDKLEWVGRHLLPTEES
jgi:sulfide:quinone oxidoreductase